MERTTLANEPPRKRVKLERDGGGGALQVAQSASDPPKPTRCTRSGKLAGIMTVPMDVFFEIMSHLHPADLLRLARTSKRVRAAVLSRASRSLWKGALARVAGLPPCPEGMCEPAYAALVFGRNCFLCGEGRAFRGEYAMRMRFCRLCHEAHVRTGRELLRILECADWLKMRLLQTAPCAIPKGSFFAKDLEAPRAHTLREKYYCPKSGSPFDRRLMKPLLDHGTFEALLAEVTEDVVERHKHASAILRWEEDVAAQERKVWRETSKRRAASIAAKLEALGWSKKDFPQTYEWRQLVYQGQDLTERVWQKIGPQLEAMLRTESVLRKIEAQRLRANRRLKTLVGVYEEYVAATVPLDEQALLPNVCDARALPTLDRIAREDGPDETLKEQFDSAIGQVLADVDAYKERAKMLAVSILPQQVQPDGSIEHAPADELLERHYALFYCSYHGGTPAEHSCDVYNATFREIHEHWRTDHPDAPWTVVSETKTLHAVGHAGKLDLANAILEAAGLSRNSPLRVLDELVQSGRLYCACGDPAMPLPEDLDWPTLLAHIGSELKRYQIRMRARKDAPNRKLVLQASHTLLGPERCIKLLPKFADTSAAWSRAGIDGDTRRKIDARIAERPLPNAFVVCRICRVLTKPCHLRRCGKGLLLSDFPEDVAHHLRSWHAKDFERGDIVFDIHPERFERFE
ncbi:hypothetical protein OH77DRAFT_1425917 [Trametes cingulata]|nr:hypothetical protein OH77DRAFT_1425917 [Trametes cingulata]